MFNICSGRRLFDLLSAFHIFPLSLRIILICIHSKSTEAVSQRARARRSIIDCKACPVGFCGRYKRARISLNRAQTSDACPTVDSGFSSPHESRQLALHHGPQTEHRTSRYRHSIQLHASVGPGSGIHNIFIYYGTKI